MDDLTRSLLLRAIDPISNGRRADLFVNVLLAALVPHGLEIVRRGPESERRRREPWDDAERSRFRRLRDSMRAGCELDDADLEGIAASMEDGA